MTIGLETAAGNVNETEQRFLISGASLNPKTSENPAPEWITKRMWNEIQNLSGVAIYNGFDEAVVEHITEWKAYFDGPTPQNEKLPGKWDGSLNPLQKIRGFAML